MVSHVPARGDVVWLVFDPHAGHEEAGRRPVVVLSPLAYNGRVGLVLVCPITRQVKGYPFEVPVPEGVGNLQGVILADQVKSLDWRVRQASLIGHLPDSTIERIVGLIRRLLS